MWFYCIIYILRKSFKILYQWSDPSCVFPAETELGNRSWTKGAHQPHEPSPPGDVEANRKSSLLLLFPSRSNGQHCSCGTLPGHISFFFSLTFVKGNYCGHKHCNTLLLTTKVLDFSIWRDNAIPLDLLLDDYTFQTQKGWLKTVTYVVQSEAHHQKNKMD